MLWSKNTITKFSPGCIAPYLFYTKCTIAYQRLAWGAKRKKALSFLGASPPSLLPFWENVLTITSKIITTSLQFTAAQFWPHPSWSSYTYWPKSLTTELINADRMCIPKLWLSMTPPTVRNWFARIERTRTMKELLAVVSDRHQSYDNTWACWLYYMESNTDPDPYWWQWNWVLKTFHKTCGTFSN